jgi:hypothetical protein
VLSGAVNRERKQAVKIARFLMNLSTCANPTDAAKEAGLTRPAVYKMRREDAAFSAAWDDAEALGWDGFEDKAKRRAVDGYDRGVYNRGVKVGTEKVYSDLLTMFFLKAARPDRYRDNASLTISGSLTLTALIEGAHSKRKLGAVLDAETGQAVDMRRLVDDNANQADNGDEV